MPVAVSARRVHPPWWGWAALVAVVIVGVNLAGWAFQRTETSARLLPGIVVIRPPFEIRTLVLDGDTLYAGGRDGLFAVDTRTREVARTVPTDRLPLGQVRGLAVDTDHTLWIAHETGLTRVSGGAARTYTTTDGLPSDRVLCVMRARDGRLWAGTDRGAAVMDGGRFRAITSKDGLLVDNVNAIAEDSRGSLWFGSYVAPHGGVSVLRDGVWSRFTTADGLPHANVTCFLPDSDGGMWVGTGFYDRGGAVRFATASDGALRIVQTLSKADGLAGEKVRSLYRGEDGRVWFGSERDGLAVPLGTGYRILTKTDGLSDDEVKAMVRGSDGVLWLGTRSGITLVRDVNGIAQQAGGAR